MCTAFPPNPGDKPVKGQYLRAVNGTRIETFGKRKIEVRIGRKTYDFEAIVAAVECPVIGWDFVRRHKLDLIWRDEDLCIRDKKAKIESVLSFKPLGLKKSFNHSKLFASSMMSRRK